MNQHIQVQLFADKRSIVVNILFLPYDEGDSLWNAMEVTRVIEAHPSVKAVLTGHRHGGGYVLRNGIHHVTFKGMVQGESNRCAVVTIDTASGRIMIDGYGDETDRVLETE